MNRFFLLSIFVFNLFFTGCIPKSEINGIFVDFSQIQKVKKRIKNGNKNYLPAYENLMEKANAALTEGPFSVMDKKRTPPSGDKHDYLSMGPYWWPDTTKPDRLPYIRRDGEVNPETRGEYVDTSEKNSLFSNVESLGWAYYFSGEKKYADKAIQLLETWFINPETRMNPNLNFAQGIPGRLDGRGIGIIDWSGINRLVSSIQILDANGILTLQTKKNLFNWFEEYLDWLQNSKYGKDEDDYFNNHGTWYDVQTVGIELMLGKTELAKNRLEQVKTKRIASQIEPDGSQPKELARTKSLGYSTMNLRGYLHLVNLGRKVDVDLWNFKTDDGRSIQNALAFLLPFAKGEKNWEHQQLGDLDNAIESLKIDFLMAGNISGNSDYENIAKSVKNKSNIEFLLYPL